MNLDKYDSLIAKMTVTCKLKNNAYGDSFHKSCRKYGPLAGLVRIEDKINRLTNLLESGGDTHDEALEDTCLDAANYLIMLAVFLTENRAPES
jgi:hypothetical protein